MKKIYVFLCTLFLSATMFAQLPDGSVAPDFTQTDLNGKEWNLYEILESGRVVIMDISATWCGPCWSYHKGGTLEQIYEDHGPEGDNSAMVLWIEGDAATNNPCLYGTTGCVGGTQGNWVTGSTFPMIEAASIFSQYNCGYYPTMFTIYPNDKTLVESGQRNYVNHMQLVNANLGNVAENAVNLKTFKSNSLSQQICGAQEAKPMVKMRNLGKSHLEMLTLELQWNGTTVQTKSWTGDVAIYDDLEVAFAPLMITGAGTLKVLAKSPNGDATAAVKEMAIEYTAAPAAYSSNMLNLNILTDNGGAYLYWAMLDKDGNIMKDGGNKAVGINGGGQYAGQAAPADAGAYGNYKNLTFQIPAPADGSCFSMVMVDGEGNGFTGPGRYKLGNVGGAYFFTMTEKFTDKIGHTFAELTSGTFTPQAVETLSAFPNPASEFLTVDFTLDKVSVLQLTVTNTMGQLVQTIASQDYQLGQNQVQVPVTALPNGTYFLNLRGSDGALTVQPFAVVK